jgi:hypothetical protein
LLIDALRRSLAYQTVMMKKLILGVLLASIVAFPTALDAQDKIKIDKGKKEKTVPEPATMLLVGAAAVGLAGVRRMMRSKRE